MKSQAMFWELLDVGIEVTRGHRNMTIDFQRRHHPLIQTTNLGLFQRLSGFNSYENIRYPLGLSSRYVVPRISCAFHALAEITPVDIWNHFHSSGLYCPDSPPARF